MTTNSGPLQRLKEEDWKVLIGRIDDKLKRCTPIIGTGMTAEMVNLRSEIAKEWALKDGYPLEDSNNLARVARFISLTYDPETPRRMLVERMLTVTRPNYQDPDDPYRILANLPLPIYVTTAYDDFMFKALQDADKEPRSDVFLVKPSMDAPPSVFAGYDPNVANPVVFHFHGQTENPDSLVLTEDDYFEFLMSVSKPQAIPARIERAFANSSLLLLGFRLTDWDFRVIFHLLASYMQGGDATTHVAVQIAPVADEAPEDQKARVKHYMDLYFARYKRLAISIYWGTSQEFLIELRDRRK